MNCEKSLHRAVISHMLSGWCKNRTRNVGDQGLQEARWVGRIFSLSAGVNKFLAICAEGVKR